MSIAGYRKLTESDRWREFIEASLLASPSDSDPDFGMYWIEGGHRIREQMGNDRALVQFLRLMLPPYSGGPVTLFRGENLERWTAGATGFAWTSQIGVAKMFASGLNAIKGGGVLLTAHFPDSAIISGPNPHSLYLGEQQFTVDPFSGTLITTLASFPQA